MSKHKKHNANKSSNPFADENSTEINEEMNLENAESTENVEEVENSNEENKETVNEENSSETEQKEEKKGIFDGLFKKSDEEVKKLKEAYDTLNNQYLRLAADFDNYRKRQESEREGLIKFGMEQALKKMIEIADNFERAEKALVSVDDCEKAKEAFDVLNKQFKASLLKLGLEEIKAEGEKFDPNFHEAVMQVPTDEHPEETVIQEMQKGYKYGEKVLRPSMVSVSVGK